MSYTKEVELLIGNAFGNVARRPTLPTYLLPSFLFVSLSALAATDGGKKDNDFTVKKTTENKLF